jgi:hypothetical protein
VLKAASCQDTEVAIFEGAQVIGGIFPEPGIGIGFKRSSQAVLVPSIVGLEWIQVIIPLCTVRVDAQIGFQR